MSGDSLPKTCEIVDNENDRPQLPQKADPVSTGSWQLGQFIFLSIFVINLMVI